MEKPFLALYGNYYYPEGANDIIGTFCSIEEATKAINDKHNKIRIEDEKHEFDYGEIYNLETCEITKLF